MRRPWREPRRLAHAVAPQADHVQIAHPQGTAVGHRKGRHILHDTEAASDKRIRSDPAKLVNRNHPSDTGVPLSLEPIHASLKDDWTLVTTIPETVALLEEVSEPNLGIGFDTWHLWDTPDLVADIRQRVKAVRA